MISDKQQDDFFVLQTEAYPLFLKKLINKYSQNGYPFIEIRPQKIQIQGKEVIIDLKITKKKKRKFDKIVVKGYEKFPKKFLQKRFYAKRNSTYSISNLKEIDTYLNSLNFVEKIKDPEILFKKDSTIVYVYLKKKKINTIDALIGFSTNENNSKLVLNGNINLFLTNIFDKGNSFNFIWNNNGNNTSSLKMDYTTPYMYRTSFSNKIGFTMLKKDSVNVNLAFIDKLSFTINQTNAISLFYNYESSNSLLKQPINNVVNYAKQFFGLGYKYTIPLHSSYENTLLDMEFAYHLGKKYEKNNEENQELFNANVTYNLQFTKRLFLNNRLLYKEMRSNIILLNELFPLGGFTTLRGYKNESLFAEKYIILNTDIKWYQNKKTNIYLLSDVAKLDNSISIFSIGLGYEFYMNNSSLINFNYVVSKQNKQSFNKGVLGIQLVTFF